MEMSFREYKTLKKQKFLSGAEKFITPTLSVKNKRALFTNNPTHLSTRGGVAESKITQIITRQTPHKIRGSEVEFRARVR